MANELHMDTRVFVSWRMTRDRRTNDIGLVHR